MGLSSVVSRHTAIVESDEPVAVGEAVELWLPRLGWIAEPRNQQHIRALSTALDPELDVASHSPLARYGLLACVDRRRFLPARGRCQAPCVPGRPGRLRGAPGHNPQEDSISSMFFVTTSIVRPSSSVGLNSTTSVPA